MKRRKFLVSLLLALLMLPLHVFAEEPTYAFSDAEVLARVQLYYSSLNQFFSNVANDNGNAAEVTLTGAIVFVTQITGFKASLMQELLRVLHMVLVFISSMS